MEFKRNYIDWEKIELDYRAGMKSLRQIAGEHGISETAIRKRAKRDEWTRDLSARIQEKAQELVRKNEVRKVRSVAVRRNNGANHARDFNHERDIVSVCGQGMAEVLLNQVDLSGRLVDFGAQLLSMAEDEDLGVEKKARVFKMIVDGVDSAVRLQRQAWGIDPKGGGHNALNNDVGARFVVDVGGV